MVDDGPIELGPVFAMEPLCSKCGNYFVPKAEGLFVEWNCGCRMKLMSMRDVQVYDNLFSAAEKSLFLNGFVGLQQMQMPDGKIVLDSSGTVKAVRERAEELSEVKSVLVEQLQFITKSI
jgi:hypothetical protein